MNAEEALAFIESVLQSDRLNSLERAVFCDTWEERSYLEIAHRQGYELGYVKQVGAQIWQHLSQALGEKVTKHNIHRVLKQQAIASPSSPAVSPSNAFGDASRTTPLIPSSSPLPKPAPKTDWGDAVESPAFVGRDSELYTLHQWILEERCHLIGIFGMGGIGKTSLTVRLARQIQHHFEVVLWRSLRNAPPLPELLDDLAQVFATIHTSAQPETLDGKIRHLLDRLRQQRCLIVLDNAETLMQQGDHGGRYLPGYEPYGRLWQCLGEAHHQSAVLMTSREKPREMAAIEGTTLPVRSLRLSGLPAQAGQALFTAKGEFSGSEAAWSVLVNHYVGNPLALKMVGAVIQTVFDGEVDSFLDCLQEGTSVFGDIHDLLAQQVNRLSPMEQQVVTWLAIARKPITLSQLRANMVPAVPLGQILEALDSLERRCLIDKAAASLMGKGQTRFTLQPVIMEYVTERLIQQVCVEILTDAWVPSTEPTQSGDSATASPATTVGLLRYSLMQAQAEDYIRETQVRLILAPVAQRLLQSQSRFALEARFRQGLEGLRGRSPNPTGYGGGNIMNVLIQLGTDLTGWDFSHITVCNAYLRGVLLHQVNATGADFHQSVFTETFSQILSVAFSPDGTLLATGDMNHDIHLWQVADGKQLLTLRVDEGWIWDVAFSPDGRLLASTANRVVKLWDVKTGRCLRTLNGYTDRVFSVSFSPDGRWLATGSEDHLVRIWQVKTGKMLHGLEGHTDEVRSVAFSPEVPLGAASSKTGGLVASGSFDGTVGLWDASRGQLIHRLEGHEGWVWCVAFSPDGQTLASGGGDRTLRLWAVDTGECIRVLTGHSQPIRTVAFSPDGRTLLSGSDDGTVRQWNYHTGEGLRMIAAHRSWISAVIYSPDGDRFATGSEDQSVKLWDSRTHLCLKTLQGYSDGVWSVAFNPQGTQLASGSQDRLIRLWNPQTGAYLDTLHGHTSWVWSVAYSPTEAVLASGSEDCTVRLWDLTTQQVQHVLTGHQDAVIAVVFTPEGQGLISASLDGTLRMWSRRTGQYQQVLNGHTGGVWCVCLSPDGQTLVSGSQDQTLKVWDVVSGQCLKTLKSHTRWIRSVALSPDGQTLVSGGADGTIHISALFDSLDEEQGDRTLQAHGGPVLSIVFHPNGQTFSSSGTDAAIAHWDAHTGQLISRMEGHQRWVRCLAYSPDGRMLASSSQDETIKLWPTDALTDGVQSRQILGSQPRTLRIPRPYEGMAIAGVTGLTPAQRTTLRMLGAVEERQE